MSSTSSSWRQPSPVGGSLVRADADDLAVRAVPDRDPVAPPQLARDAPVVHVVDPVEVALAPARPGRSRTRPSRTASPAALRQRLDLDEPLQRQPRLDRRLAPRAVADRVHVRPLLGDDPALLAQRGDDRRPCLEPVQPLERAVRGDHAALVHDGERSAGRAAGRSRSRSGRAPGSPSPRRCRTPGRRARRRRSGSAGRSAAARPRCRPGAGTARRRGARPPRCRRASSRPGWSRPRSTLSPSP